MIEAYAPDASHIPHPTSHERERERVGSKGLYRALQGSKGLYRRRGCCFNEFADPEAGPLAWTPHHVLQDRFLQRGDVFVTNLLEHALDQLLDVLFTEPRDVTGHLRQRI